MAETKQYFFIDTRDNAKSSEPFSITNPDVAKTWTRDFSNGEGPFKPVTEEAAIHQINRRDLQEQTPDGQPLSVQKEAEATAHNLNVLEADHMVAPAVTTVEGITSGQYSGMNKTELQDELDARNIEYKKSGPESTNESYIKLLQQDDAKDETNE